MLDPAKAEALEKRLKKQRMAETKHHVQELDLWKETFKLIMEGINRATGCSLGGFVVAIGFGRFNRFKSLYL